LEGLKQRHEEAAASHDATVEDLEGLTAEFTALLESCERWEPPCMPGSLEEGWGLGFHLGITAQVL